MNGGFSNVYEDPDRAASYAHLEFPGTYFLAFRDLPQALGPLPDPATALDFGCGAGRSTRFLRRLGYRAVGVDVSTAMLEQAKQNDPDGHYQLVGDGDLSALKESRFSRILCAFPFDNVPSAEKKTSLLAQLRQHLQPGGRLINLVSAPEIYWHEWLSFSTRDFPENRATDSGGRVRIVMLDVPDSRPVEDVLWTEAAYLKVYQEAGFRRLAGLKPLGGEDDGIEWGTEREVAPWRLDVLEARA